MNLIVGMETIRIRDFTRMNPLKFHGSKVDEDSQEFIDGMYKILEIIGFSPMEKTELASYQLKVLLFKFGLTNGRERRLLMWVLLIGRSSNGCFLIISFPLR